MDKRVYVPRVLLSENKVSSMSLPGSNAGNDSAVCWAIQKWKVGDMHFVVKRVGYSKAKALEIMENSHKSQQIGLDFYRICLEGSEEYGVYVYNNVYMNKLTPTVQVILCGGSLSETRYKSVKENPANICECMVEFTKRWYLSMSNSKGQPDCVPFQVVFFKEPIDFTVKPLAKQ
jgi:hypothetical protein